MSKLIIELYHFLLLVVSAVRMKKIVSGRTLYKDSDCLLLVFDITSLESFAALDAYLANYILYGQHEDPTDFSVIVVGNKADKASKRQVPVEAVHRWCELQRPLKPLVYLECSALDNKGVKEVFTEAARMVYNFMNYEEGSSRFSDAPLTSNMSRMSETDDFEYDKNTSTTSALIGSFSTPINTGASANTTEISPIFDHDEIYRGVAGSSRGSTPFSSAKERGREQGTEEERMISSLRQQQNQLESPSLNPLFNAAKNSKNASSSSSSVTATGANTTDDITNREEEMGVFIRFLHKLMFDAFLPQRIPPVKDVEQQRQDLRSVSGDTCSERSLVIPRSSSPLLTAQQVSKTQQTTYKPLFSRALCVFDCGAGAGPVMSDGEDSERPKSPPPSRCGGRSATAASASQSTNSDSAAPNTSSSYLQQSKDMPEFNPDK